MRLVEELARLDLDRIRELAQRRDFRVAFPGLHPTDLGDVDAAALCDFFLGEAEMFPCLSQFGPEVAHAWIVCAGDRKRHRELHNPSRRLPSSMPPRNEDEGAGRGPHTSGSRPAPYIARLSRASSHARTTRLDRPVRPSSKSPPFLVFQRVVPLDKEGMLRKIRVSTKTRPADAFFSRQALMLWPA